MGSRKVIAGGGLFDFRQRNNKKMKSIINSLFSVLNLKKLSKKRFLTLVLVLLNFLFVFPVPNDKFQLISGAYWGSLIGSLIGWLAAILLLSVFIKWLFKKLKVGQEKTNTSFISLDIALIIYLVIRFINQ